MIKEFFKPTARKILVLIILLALLSFINFLPRLFDPLPCTNLCIIIFGGPLLPFLTLNIRESQIHPVLNISSLIIDLIIFYLIVCALFYVFRKRKKETLKEVYVGEQNVPTGNSGR